MEIVGRTIGRYQIAQMIGEGGMAQVYKAYDPEIDRSVALKILRTHHCLDDEHRTRFVREGKAAGALAHPNIVTIYDVGTLDDAPYIMMELLEGDTLADVLHNGEKPSTETVLQYAAQLASALDYAHDKGVIHRDLKPENIMVSPDGETVKIADFGIARMEEASNQDTTSAGMMLGTPRYMSPEQASGEPVDGRSDLFTLGVILYEMVTGHKAFDADSMPTLIMQIVNKDPLPIRQINASTPVGLQKIINKLLQKKPQRRFSNGRALGEALERELQALREKQTEDRHYLPLPVKWTAIMSSVVALAMIVSSVLVYQAQRDALIQLEIDSGVALARFTAVQAAVPVLGEDWITLESFVQDASARETFRYLVVSDHNGVVRAATDSARVGSQWQPGVDGTPIYKQDDTLVTALKPPLEDVFNFHLPVLFQETVVGHVDVGVDTYKLNEALATTRRLMAILGLAIVGAVSGVVYLFNKLTAKNLNLATQAINLFGDGQLATRISKRREDEFGDLFDAFNAMADEIEQQVEAGQCASNAEAGHERNRRASTLEVSGIVHSNVDEETVVQKWDDDNA